MADSIRSDGLEPIAPPTTQIANNPPPANLFIEGAKAVLPGAINFANKLEAKKKLVKEQQRRNSFASIVDGFTSDYETNRSALQDAGTLTPGTISKLQRESTINIIKDAAAAGLDVQDYTKLLGIKDQLFATDDKTFVELGRSKLGSVTYLESATGEVRVIGGATAESIAQKSLEDFMSSATLTEKQQLADAEDQGAYLRERALIQDEKEALAKSNAEREAKLKAVGLGQQELHNSNLASGAYDKIIKTSLRRVDLAYDGIQEKVASGEMNFAVGEAELRKIISDELGDSYNIDILTSAGQPQDSLTNNPILKLKMDSLTSLLKATSKEEGLRIDADKATSIKRFILSDAFNQLPTDTQNKIAATTDSKALLTNTFLNDILDDLKQDTVAYRSVLANFSDKPFTRAFQSDMVKILEPIKKDDEDGIVNVNSTAGVLIDAMSQTLQGFAPAHVETIINSFDDLVENPNFSNHASDRVKKSLQVLFGRLVEKIKANPDKDVQRLSKRVQEAIKDSKKKGTTFTQEFERK